LKIFYVKKKEVVQIARVRNERIMRMLFSRSGINLIKNENENIFNFGQQKIMLKKLNGAILPCKIYTSPSKINFNKSTLIKILKTENKIRLSNESKTLYDINCHKEKEIHLALDEKMIKEALIQNGFNPEIDDSLKAYHYATEKFKNDADVNESVVWMKYDKCKKSNYTKGDLLDFAFKDIKIYSLKKKEFLLVDLLNNYFKKKKYTLIVSGSLS
jgi:hypothetical protein